MVINNLLLLIRNLWLLDALVAYFLTLTIYSLTKIISEDLSLKTIRTFFKNLLSLLKLNNTLSDNFNLSLSFFQIVYKTEVYLKFSTM